MYAVERLYLRPSHLTWIDKGECINLLLVHKDFLSVAAAVVGNTGYEYILVAGI